MPSRSASCAGHRLALVGGLRLAVGAEVAWDDASRAHESEATGTVRGLLGAIPDRRSRAPGFIVSVMANQPKNPRKKKQEQEAVGPRRALLRSKDDRVLWGVAGGLAEHIGFNATLVRIAFVVTTLFGGAGLLAYLVLAVALPEDDGTGNPVPESVWARLGKVFVVCVLVAIGLAVAAFLAAVSAWTTATGHGTIVAASRDRARHRAGRVRLRPGVAAAQHAAAAHHGAGARHPRRSDRGRRHRHRRIDRPADLHAERGGRPPRRRLQARHGPARRRSPGAALAEGQDHRRSRPTSASAR